MSTQNLSKKQFIVSIIVLVCVLVFIYSIYKNKNNYIIKEANYDSATTTKITLSEDNYSLDVKSLPPIRSLDQILKEDQKNWDDWVWLYKEQIKEYGQLVSRFLMGDYITKLEKFDVDKDGIDETIISTCGTGGNHCPHKILIVKNNKIIFSANSYYYEKEVLQISPYIKLSKSETGDGFYFEWTPVPEKEKGSKWDTGLCCPIGYMNTRFLYFNGVFKPVYESEVLYPKK